MKETLPAKIECARKKIKEVQNKHSEYVPLWCLFNEHNIIEHKYATDDILCLILYIEDFIKILENRK